MEARIRSGVTVRDGLKYRGFIGIGLVGFLCLLPISTTYSANRPFWTEKSSFIEGDELFVVGIASRAKTTEEGRRQAFEQAKRELMNFAQITSLESQGLVIETQMTFEEPNADGTVTVYRLLRVPAAKLVAIQGRLQARSRAQEQAIDQSRNELAAFQQSLTEKATKLDQQQRQVEHMLQQIRTEVDRLKETDAQLGASEQELSRLARRIQEYVMARSQKACQAITPGMFQSEVKQLLGDPDSSEEVYSGYTRWEYRNTIIHFKSSKIVSWVECSR